tara:strand:- start:3119 stop:3592 length:474 start_codon:yes stop_codon:yes gene_type:complete
MAYAIFNENGNLLCYSPHKLEGRDHKEVPEGIDLTSYGYVGTYEEGDFKLIKDIEGNTELKTEVFESDLNIETKEKFEKYCPVHKQINSVINIILNNKNKLKINNDDLKTLETSFKIKANHEDNIKTYKENENDFIYISIENHQKYISDESEKSWIA